MLHADRHDPALRATYGDGTHRCVRCDNSRALLTEATPRQARDNAWLCAGDLLCPVCDADLTAAADADARDEMLLGTAGPCDECGRHMDAPRGPTCSVCLAGHFSPGVSVPRAAGEGPRPAQTDRLTASIVAELRARGLTVAA